jgi:cyclic-di-AMP phosphodiesterase PgpH
MTIIRNKIATYLPKAVQIILFVAMALLIALLFPSQVKVKYDVKPGQTWRLDDLPAPFDFAVRRTGVELENEQRRVLEDFSPYYRLDDKALDRRTALFEKTLTTQIAQLAEAGEFPDVIRRPDTYLNYGKRLLQRIYARGIIRPAPEHADKGKTFVINIIQGNTSYQQTFEYYYTEKSVQALLVDSLPASNLSEPDFLYPILEKMMEPNIVFDAEMTENFRNEILSGVPQYRGMVKKGELIVTRNGIVTDEVYQKILSMQEQYEQEVASRYSAGGIGAGYFILAFLLTGIFFVYLKNREPEVLQHLRKLLFVSAWVVLYAWLVYWAEHSSPVNAYFIPFCIAPIIIQTFFNKRLALFTHIITVLTASFISSLGWDFTFLQMLAGIVILLTNVDVNSWSRFFLSIVAVLLTLLTTFVGLTLVEQGNLLQWNWTVVIWIFLSAFLTLLALPLVPLLERVFGFTSALRLRELMDLNRPLLQNLATKTPGTFQHSIQVGNLSEAAAREIGADTLLVKVGALYHDIGKMANPDYFVENQAGIENPHSEKSYTESAKIIIGHVAEGIQMARKYRLPQVLIEFIATHHGTTRVEFFYRKMVNESSEAEVVEEDFRYPGPKPRTREQTIMMMADSIEAACKSLKQPSEQDIYDLIDKIIAGKINLGQMDESALTFQELEQCRRAFKKMMKSVHHQRIEYPELKTR